ncbi:MAG: alternative ribosome rescue aminoacyl-tRNA hydrolase ArfB [Bacteroidota bacterium]
MSSIIITSDVSIPLSEIHFQFSRSGGPGGQNVNRIATKVELRFDIKHSSSFSEEQRVLLLQQLARRIDRRGIFHLSAQESRSQWMNRQKVLDRFRNVVAHALVPRKKRIRSVPTSTSCEERLRTKKHRSAQKRLRRIRDEE